MGSKNREDVSLLKTQWFATLLPGDAPGWRREGWERVPEEGRWLAHIARRFLENVYGERKNKKKYNKWKWVYFQNGSLSQENWLNTEKQTPTITGTSLFFSLSLSLCLTLSLSVSLRLMLKEAKEKNGLIVTNDKFRDLKEEKKECKDVIDK